MTIVRHSSIHGSRCYHCCTAFWGRKLACAHDQNGKCLFHMEPICLPNGTGAGSFSAKSVLSQCSFTAVSEQFCMGTRSQEPRSGANFQLFCTHNWILRDRRVPHKWHCRPAPVADRLPTGCRPVQCTPMQFQCSVRWELLCGFVYFRYGPICLSFAIGLCASILFW